MVPKEDYEVPHSRRFSISEAAVAVRKARPLLYLRFSDGELHSIHRSVIARGRNADKSHWLPDTMGEELRECLEWAACEAAYGAPFRIELPLCWNQWPAMREWIGSLPWAALRKFSTGQIWPFGIMDSSVYLLLDALRDARCPKVVLASETCRTFAEAIGGVLVPCPIPDAYLAMEQIVTEARAALDGTAGIVLSSIGMASECAMRRLWDGKSVVLDMGHTPDALVGNRVRRSYLRSRNVRVPIVKRFTTWSQNDRDTSTRQKTT